MSSHLRIEDPNYPAHHTDDHDGNVTLPSSVDIATTRLFHNTPMTPIVGAPMRHTFSLSLPRSGKNRQRISIEILPDDTLLEIFDFIRMEAMKHTRAHGRPWNLKWHRLAHVCQRWRFVISTSPLRLGLQILCKSGASIERVLDSWGTLPLIVRFKGRKTNSLPQNIGIALSRPDRVREIDLALTSTAFMSIVDAIKKPFQTLECIRITIINATEPLLLFDNAFLGGSAPRLREITLDGINFPFPEMNRVISSNNLVELRISRIPKTGYFSADALVTALSVSTKLRELQVGFHYPASLPTQSTTSPPLQRTSFPSLWLLEFHGASEYLEDFVSRVDFPSLSYMTTEFFNQIFFEIPEFCRSIPLLSAFRSPSEVEILLSDSEKRVFISFKPTRRGKRGISSGTCYLKTETEQLDWKLSFVTEVLSQLSLLLKSVGTLRVIGFSTGGSDVMTGQEDVESTQWVELFQLFTHVKQLHASGPVLQDIMHALVTEDVAAGGLPELTQLSLMGQFCTPAVVDAAEQFVAALQRSGRDIHLSIN